MTRPSHALVVDTHRLFREAFGTLLRRDCGFATVLETASLDEALQMLDEHREIVFASFDLATPGIGNPLSLRSVREVYPDLRIAALAAASRREDIFLALRAGLHGFVAKTFEPAEIIRAVGLIMEGGIFVPPDLVELPLAAEAGGEPGSERRNAQPFRLTPRQLDVLRLIRSGLSNKEIAKTLGLTENTVKVHANALYRALGVKDRSGAMKWAETPGLS
ncbi:MULTISPECIES: LuxR C-terminal-related transcriptional regulator [Methylobacterium]|uniref:LuxR C-terminal-related transcriptional regulator n=1 Tax=Methylobacterium TaxID=407 RepID=UPI00104E63EF|nr:MULTISPECIES: response regulator transcription factor [Methylobacterium]MDR7040160.1 DNA-binding NarL/FixJ family response regulator [Methylobacterium sp. BE186]